MTRPNFFVIGAHKAGTTSLCNMLGQHPDVFVSQPKEPDYFTRRFEEGPQWYERRFQAADGESAVGEGSTSYAMVGVFPGTPGRISEYNADARIIYMVRHPLQRMTSAWIQHRAAGRPDVPDSFPAALRSVPELVDASCYHRQLSAYRRHFGPDQIHVAFFEDFARDAENVVRGVFEFLGVDTAFTAADEPDARNASEGKRDPGALMRAAAKANVPGRRHKVLSRAKRTRAGRWLASGSSRRMIEALFTKPLARPEWDVETRTWALDQVRDDAERILEEFGKDPSIWDLST